MTNPLTINIWVKLILRQELNILMPDFKLVVNLVNMNQYFEIIKTFKLEKYLHILLNYNSANAAPYHNFYHTLCVLQHSHDIAMNEQIKTNEIRQLLIAAMFHDFNHSQGKLKDSENVLLAIRAWKNYQTIQTEIYTSDSYDTEYFAVIDIIKATEYPYVIPEEQLSLNQKIIRDADLLQLFKDNYLQQNLIGLSVEMNLPLSEIIAKSKIFWENIKFHTDYAKQIAERMFPSRVEDIAFLKTLL